MAQIVSSRRGPNAMATWICFNTIISAAFGKGLGYKIRERDGLGKRTDGEIKRHTRGIELTRTKRPLRAVLT